MPVGTCPDGGVSGPTGRCLEQVGGGCGWEVLRCEGGGGGSQGSTSGGCARAGCSGQLCVPEDGASDIMTTCEFRPEYGCYAQAACERQTDGTCGFTQTPALRDCLADPPAD